jgi:hypothetical protein
MSSSLVKTLNLVHEFAHASQRKDLSYLAQLLSDSGEFEIQDESLEICEVDKTVFLEWFAQELNHTAINSISYDQCLHCQIGASVVLFNGGTFPRKIKDSSERVKSGYMVDVKEDKIENLKFCFVFLKTENKYKFQCNIEEMQEDLKKGLSIAEALEKRKRDSALDK